MASLSLPRVLQLKKNSLDAEREHFEKFQSLAIGKAINSIETPVKEKHVRSTIIGTFQEQSAITYWMVAIRLPLQDNRIVAWKFCHVTHKLLREGHPACLDDSQRHIGMIENLGRLWVHLREGYGRLVHLYCALLVSKLKFHGRNPRFPGNMQLTADELDNIAENDVNNYFQLCVELFDYMDDILNLQAAVFDSLGNARANSMTASGQCRLAALIPCAQDSSHIYDCNVRLLFRLHASLPADTLAGHRERFRTQFKKLSQFYKHASSLQYYRNLLSLPVLPASPPNFLLQSDFGTYVTPVVSIPEPPPDEVDAVGALIDTSDTISQATTPDQFEAFDTRTTPSPQPDPLVERDRLIDHLQSELKRMRAEVSQLVQERNSMLGSMREHCTRIEKQLQSAKTELEEERQKAETLSTQTPEIKQKLAETEEKAKVTDEKFQKLKGAYTQLREEHITLIRQKAEVDKIATGLRAAAAQQESAKAALQQQLSDRMKDMELLQQSASASEEIEAYKNEMANLRTELEQSRQKETELETLRASMEALEIEHKAATTEQQESIATITNELKETKETLETLLREKEERENELSRVKVELIALREKSGDEYKKVVDEREVALKQVAELTQQYQQEKEEQGQHINDLQTELETLQITFFDAENSFKSQCEKIEQEFTSKNQELNEALVKKDAKLEETLAKLNNLESEFLDVQKNHDRITEIKDNEIGILQDKVNELMLLKNVNEYAVKDIEKLKDTMKIEISNLNQEKESLQKSVEEKESEISNLGNVIKELQENSHRQKAALEQIENYKNLEISKLQEQMQIVLQEKEDETNKARNEIERVQSKLDETAAELMIQKADYETLRKENEHKIFLLEDKLKTVTDCKDELIEKLERFITEKDEQVVSLNVDVNNLSIEKSRLEDELKETHAELEITKNEMLALKEEYEQIIEMNEQNVILKNTELRSRSDEVVKLMTEKTELIAEKQKLIDEFNSVKQVMENKIKDVEDLHKHKTEEYNSLQHEISELNANYKELQSECLHLKNTKEAESKILTDKLQDTEIDLNNKIAEKDIAISEAYNLIKELKEQIESLEKEREKDKENMDQLACMREKETKILESRLSHAESGRLNAECELQDLLQHNTILEADLTAAKKQVEDTQKEVEKQNARLVKCAGEAALQVTNNALSALDQCNVQESNKVAAELAAKALEDLARQTEMRGNEESVARSAVFAAHNSASLAAYVTDVCNTCTDVELSDKLNHECRAMLTSIKQTLESVSVGSFPGTEVCATARGQVRGVASAVATADRANSGARNVDDELADMDSAIEHAASQIEDMLKASRAGDTGVKLEVNEKILDACTALMQAVKVLVQDARKLQSELGDPNTRQRMYRRNPQWSQGLISAAKAVVFAAKLLVSSADEAVGSGRVEGVSAAAHEVAGSTAQLVAASRARAPRQSPALARLTSASRGVAAATGAVVAAVRAGSALVNEQEALDTSSLTLTATRILEMESKVRALELETALDRERARLAALRKRHYALAHAEENGNMTNGKE